MRDHERNMVRFQSPGLTTTFFNAHIKVCIWNGKGVFDNGIRLYMAKFDDTTNLVRVHDIILAQETYLRIGGHELLHELFPFEFLAF